MVCHDERRMVQGRKLKGATAGEPVSGAPADSVVRLHKVAQNLVCCRCQASGACVSKCALVHSAVCRMTPSCGVSMALPCPNGK